MKKLIIICAFLYSLSGFAQQMQLITITSEYNSEKGQWTFYADNPNFYPVTMHITFNRMTNVTSSVFSDSHVLIPGGRKTVCYRITKNNMNAAVDWERKYTYYMGNPYAEHNNDVVYFLPVLSGKKVMVRNLVPLSKRFKHKDDGDSLIACQFLFNDGDTVFACRKGLVCEVEDGIGDDGSEHISFKREVNYILVLQPDQTFAKYKIFKKDAIFVEPGETVYPGTPLGLAGGKNFSNGYQMRFQVYKPLKRTDENVKNKHFWEFYRPKFIFNEGDIAQLEFNREYVSIHPVEHITAEMSKREKKKWLKKNELVKLKD